VVREADCEKGLEGSSIRGGAAGSIEGGAQEGGGTETRATYFCVPENAAGLFNLSVSQYVVWWYQKRREEDGKGEKSNSFSGVNSYGYGKGGT